MVSASNQQDWSGCITDGDPHKNDRIDFVETTKAIYNSTPVPDEAYVVILNHCINHLCYLRSMSEFTTAVPDMGVLAGDTVRHQDLTQAVHTTMR